MPNDAIREMLAAKDRERQEGRSEDPSLWGLVNGIHKGAALRDWVTLESRPLQPLVVAQDAPGEAVVHLLLAAASAADREGPLTAPWALVSWSWPKRRLLGKRDLTDHPSRTSETLDRSMLASRRGCEAIEEALRAQAPIPKPAEPLATIYRTILRPPRAHATEGPLYDIRDLLRESGQIALLAEWSRIAARTRAPRFTVVVAGEFSRGKSRLINTLLERKLLPEGDLPTTAMLARVAHGERGGIWRVQPDGNRSRLDPAEETWAELCADDDGEDPEGVLHVVVDNQWLGETGLQIVDTPGAGDLEGGRAALATEAIASSDATLVTVSATMPLSLTERAFIEQNVLMRAVPRVAVVITRLDQINEDERVRVIDSVAARVSEFAPGAEIWSAHGEPIVPAGSAASCAGPEAIRDALAEWAADPEAATHRDAQLTAQLTTLLEDCERGLAVRRQAAQLRREQRLDEINEAIATLERRQMDWTDLELEVDRRAYQLAQKLREKIFEQETELIENYTHELASSGDPVKWWDEQLPFRFRKDLGKRIQVLQGTVERFVRDDAEWLQQQTAQRFSATLKMPQVESFVADQDPALPDRPEALGSIRNTNLVYTAGVAAVGIAVYAVAGPLLVVPLAVGGGLARVKILEAKAQNQREKMRPAVQQAVRDRLKDAADGVRDRINSIYRRMVEALRRQETAWLSTEEAALRAGAKGDDGDDKRVDDWLSRAAQFKQQIIRSRRNHR